MEPETLTITIDDRDSVTALLYLASKGKQSGVTVVLGHGAGANHLSAFMVMIARGLAARGCDVMTFNFAYKERGRSIPDPRARLESCYQAVIKTAQTNRKLKKNRLVIGGKSMGGRMSSQAAADGLLEEVRGLVFFGFPLHPPKQPGTKRAEHLSRVQVPMLFLQGARDALADLQLLRPICKELAPRATLHVIETADHSFRVLKKSGRSDEEALRELATRTAEWAEGIAI